MQKCCVTLGIELNCTAVRLDRRAVLPLLLQLLSAFIASSALRQLEELTAATAGRRHMGSAPLLFLASFIVAG
jgi:hypothetical protein